MSTELGCIILRLKIEIMKFCWFCCVHEYNIKFIIALFGILGRSIFCRKKTTAKVKMGFAQLSVKDGQV